MKRILAALAGAALLVVAPAAPASAHAELTSTDPVGGAVLAKPPDHLTLDFSESVAARGDAVRLYDREGDRVDTGRVRHAGGRGSEVVVDVPRLDEGAYVVTWQVTSSDSHPVHGAFTFRVGDAPAADTDAVLRDVLGAAGGSRSVDVAYGIVRFLAFASLILFVGGAAFALAVWPAGAARFRRVLVAAWAASLVTTAAGLCLQAVYGTSRPLGDVFRWSVVSDVFETRFGHAWLARLGLLLVAGPVVLLATRAAGPMRRVATTASALLTAGTLLTPGIAGHPGADSPAAVTVGVDALHLGAVSVWLGGLALLLTVVLRVEVEEALEPVRRFSATALVAVSVILATGVYQGWRQSRSVDAVTGTTYGRLLLAKLGFFVGMVALAAVSRAWVRAHRGQGERPSAGRLRRSVAGEAIVGFAVVVAASLLVNTVPARSALAQPSTAELHTDAVLIDLTVDPARAGPIDIHAYTLTHAGAVTDVEELTVQLTLPGRDIGPLDVPLERAGPGHFAAYGFDIPIPGEWRFDVAARTTDIDLETATTTVRIR